MFLLCRSAEWQKEACELDVQVGDILEMKKPHPCGEKRFSVLRVGMDFKIRCVKCSREVMVPRIKIEKNIKHIYRNGIMVEK